MPVSFPEIRKFAGLFLQRNSFNVPDGALEVAENVVVSQDETIQKVRGSYEYYDALTGTISNLTLYRNKLVAIFSDAIGYFNDTGASPNETGTYTDLTGSYPMTVTAPRKSRTLQANDNLYFTSDQGVLKLENTTSNVAESGIAPAIDLEGVTYPSAGSGPILGNPLGTATPTGTQVSYRVVFGRRDSNENLLLGAPSQRFYYVNAPIEATVEVVTHTATVICSTPHNLSVGSVVNIAIRGAVTLPVDVVGSQTVVTVVSPTTYTFTTPTTNNHPITNCYVSCDRSVLLQIGIPSELDATSGYFCQIYRTSMSGAYNEIPGGDWALIDEITLTASHITNQTLTYVDEVAELFRAQNQLLYTNENSGEGEAQANYRPPLCGDVTYFKNHAIFANCATRHLLNLSVVTTDTGASGDVLTFRTGATDQNYKARVGYGNTLTGAYQSTIAVSGTNMRVTTASNHGYLTGDNIYVAGYIGTGTLNEAYYTVSYVSATQFDIVGAAASASAPKFLCYWVDSNLAGNKIFSLSQIPGVVGTDLAVTARGIVKAINRDENGLLYAVYSSIETGVPGQLYVQGKSFVDTIYAKASTSGLANCFAPTLPTSFSSGAQVFSTNDLQPNVFFASKVLEPEAVPIANFFPVGVKNASILRMVALRDSMIVIKEDGIFRVTGTGPQDYDVTVLDNTVFCVASDSVVVLNNFVYMLSNQGVVRISENSVEIISRKIENVIAPILGQTNLIERTSALGYESERQYQLSTTQPNNDSKSVTYLYNYINDTWTTRTQLFKAAALGPNNILYVVTDDNVVMRERKTQTRIDYCGQNYTVSVNSADPDGYGAIITSATGTPQVGDILVKSNIFSRITSATNIGGSLYSVRFSRLSSLQTGDTPILYKGFSSTIKTAPIHAGMIGRAKQFTQMQLHLRDNALSYLTISFTNAQFGGSAQVLWDGVSVFGSSGWGFGEWGFVPWGQEEGIENNYSTTQAPICRIYIPLFSQRTTFLQPVIVHSQAGEPIDIQAMSLAVRAYNERVSK